MNYNETEEFKHDIKKLLKKFSSLREDLEVNKQYRIELFHCKDINSNGIFEIEDVGNTNDLRFFKIKKFQCKSLKGKGARSGIRVIYAYLPINQTVVFLEIYFKSDQEKEKRERISDFIKNK